LTVPSERYRAIKHAREFLRSLLDPKQTPRIPKKIRTQAYWCLRHFPWDLDMDKVAKKCPETFEKPKDE
jgi:hypothetical protein